MKIASLLRRSALCSAVLLAMTPSAFAVDFVFSTGVYLPGTTAPEPLVAGQVLQINAGGNKFFSASTFTNQSGLVNWNADALFMQSGALINNQSVWDARSDNALVYNGGATPTFNNSGTFRKGAGAGITSIGSIAFVNSGIIDAQTGTINFGGGNATFNAGSQFTGAGATLVSNNATFNGAFTSSNLALTAGTFTGGAAQINGNLNFTGGAFTGAWEIASGQSLSGKSGGNKFLSGAALTNNGTVQWQTGDSLYMQNGASLDNRGLFDLQTGAAIVYNGGPQSTYTNAGGATLRVAAGQTATIGSIAFVNNGGALEAGAGGTLNFAGNNATFNAGSTFTGAGAVAVTGNATFVGTQTSTNLSLRNGGFTGIGAVLNGSAELTGGFLQGDWTVAGGATLNGVNGGNKFLSGAALTNNGTVQWQTGNSLYMQNGASLDNRGLFDLQTDSAIVYNGGAGGTFINTGLIVKSGGTGTSTIGNSLGFDNQGVVDVRSGTIRLPDSFTNHGTLMGVGAFATNALTNSGHAAPGDSTGLLTLNGNYIQTLAGVLDIELASSTLFDTLFITGTADLDGTLALHCIAACALNIGDVFVILDSTDDLTGTFASVTALGFGNAFQFSVIYDYGADQVRLQVTTGAGGPGSVPEPGTWALLFAGLGALAAAARRRPGRAD